jgi:hypothetical protein
MKADGGETFLLVGRSNVAVRIEGGPEVRTSVQSYVAAVDGAGDLGTLTLEVLNIEARVALRRGTICRVTVSGDDEGTAFRHDYGRLAVASNHPSGAILDGPIVFRVVLVPVPEPEPEDPA